MNRIRRFVKNPKRVKQTFLSRIARWGNFPIPQKVKLKTGSKMKVVLPDTLSIVVSYDGDFEPEVTNMMKKVLKPGNVFFDVGAHFGLRTIQAVDITNRDIKIVAFEPSSFQLKVLKENTKFFRQVTIVPKVVSNNSGRKLPFYVFDYRFIGSNTLDKPRLSDRDMKTALSKSRKILVETVSLDSYCRSTGVAPDLIKVDVENHEMQVLIGAKYLLNKLRPKIILEIGNINRSDSDSTEACLKYLSNIGYSFQYWNGKKLAKYTFNDRPEIENILAS